MQILCAVELDDRSHERSDRQQRDAFLDKAFKKAKLPLFHIPCKKNYGAKELNELCRFLCSDMLELSDEEEVEEVPICPDCGIPMVLRTASRGEHKGQQFLWMPQFPGMQTDKTLSGIKTKARTARSGSPH